jgi:hypothetical protein
MALTGKNNIANTVVVFPPFDKELDFVDDDIKLAFLNSSYIQGLPTQIQLSRDIRNLTLAMQDIANNKG